MSSRHLRDLENESIEILREAAAEFNNPVMLYSIGKDSSVLLHLVLKAFYPSPPPFPLLHVDTTWKFKEMIAFRDQTVARKNLKLIVHMNQQGLSDGIGPISHGSAVHTTVMKTEALRQALDEHRFDAAIGGARRDEEKSRAKERVFSHRTSCSPVGSSKSAPRTVAAVQYEASRRRHDAGLSLVELDRKRCVALHCRRTDSCRPALFCQAAASCRARRHADHGR